METKQTQIKINLPEKLKNRLADRARRFGVPVSFYIKHLIIKDADEEMPIFQASKRAENAYLQSLRDEVDGKLIAVDDPDQFFEKL